MRLDVSMSAAQLRAARGLVGWSQQDLADKAEVGRATIADFESGKRVPYATTLLRLQEALMAGGVEFIPENGGGAGVRLRKSAK
jgi:transcriptional regulator with XRE-family HTH domain